MMITIGGQARGGDCRSGDGISLFEERIWAGGLMLGLRGGGWDV
jgi:hypothetical protein